MITRLYRKLRHLGLAFVILLLASTAWGKTSLLDHYHRLKNGKSITLPGTHISLSSSIQENALSAEVSSIVDTPFDAIVSSLSLANNWCQIMPLHFNIKACTYKNQEGNAMLTVYSGRKIYEHPEDSYEMTYRFEVVKQDNKQLSLRLHADQGPIGTSNYLIELDAVPIAEGTLLQIHSSYQPSWLSSMLASTYLSTVGSGKVGFSRIEQDGELRPIRGIKGVIERNVMRYQIAIDAFLNNQSLPESSRHEATLASWFKQNESYPQLHEMDEAEYLEIKREEWNNQQQLQRGIDEGLKLVENP